jgi:hypothetical protein
MTSREVCNLWVISGQYVGWQGGNVAVDWRRDETIRCGHAVREPWGCQPLHSPCPLPARLGRIVRLAIAATDYREERR